MYWQMKLGFRLLLLVNILKKIGFRSYSRFKVNLAQQNSQSIDEQIDKDDSIKTIQSKLIKTVTRSYEMTIELIDDDTLDHVIDLLKNANKIYTFGVGASGLVCSDIYFKLSRIGKNIVYHTDSHIQLASLSNATEKDLVSVSATLPAQEKSMQPLKLLKNVASQPYRLLDKATAI